MPIERILEKRELLHCNINIGSYQTFIKFLTQRAAKLKSSYICVANVHMLIEAHKNPSFAQILKNADMVTPDGAPVALGLKLLYGVHQDRVAGMDIMPSLISESSKSGIGIYFYGSTVPVLNAIKVKINQLYPEAKIAGMHSPPFRKLTVAEEDVIVEKINKSGAGFVFVALGCPKQEIWMASMKGRINAVMIGLGGAFPVFAGTQSRAPKWMQEYSLEWLYRLIQEPGRLWKRYFYTNSLFLILFMLELMKVKILGKKIN